MGPTLSARGTAQKGDFGRPELDPARRPSPTETSWVNDRPKVGGCRLYLLEKPAHVCCSCRSLPLAVGGENDSQRFAPHFRSTLIRLPPCLGVALRLGLGRTLRRTPQPFGPAGRSTTSHRVTGHYPGFVTTTVRLTPRSASDLPFPCGYGAPTLAGPARQADAAPCSRRGLSTDARDATSSPQITPSALSPHPRRTTYSDPRA